MIFEIDTTLEDPLNGNIHSSTVEVLESGSQTSIQDYPGRKGYWSIGLPPSGPMDDWAARVANKLIGNNNEAPLLEATFIGPTLRMNQDVWIAVTGAGIYRINGKDIPSWKSVFVQ